MDKYNNFDELKSNETCGVDYEISITKRNENITILAIHGGGIEIGTSEVAEKLSRKGGYSSYIFEALRTKDNRELHITATNFDDPVARNMVQESKTTLAIHGYTGEEEIVYVGELNEDLKNAVIRQLKDDGFDAREAPSDVGGVSPENIVNDNKIRAGVQFELTTALRKNFFKDGNWSRSNRVNTTDKFNRFVDSLYTVVGKQF